MAENDVIIRPLAEADLSEIAALLAAEEFGDDSVPRLRAAFTHLQDFSLVAMRANHIEAAALANFNGWHVFLSHLVVAPSARKKGIGKRLVDTLTRTAAEAGAKGLIADARLSTVGFFQKLGFRLPGAIFLINDV
jgi:N-acetylglutamate synthase-like GNAT family acetyltransferase